MSVKKLLVVEDNPSHLLDAKRYVRGFGWEQGIVFVESYSSARRALDTGEYYAVLTDLFLPPVVEGESVYGSIREDYKKKLEGAESPREKCAHEILNGNGGELQSDLDSERNSSWQEAFMRWRNNDSLTEADAPLGILIAKRARELELHVRICTDTYHHGNSTQPVNKYIRSQNRLGKKMGRLIEPSYKLLESEGDPWTISASKKPWDVAFEAMGFRP